MTPEEIAEEIQKETALLESMLKPISEEDPTGKDIRDDSSPISPYYTIKDARNSARAAERQNAFDGDATEAGEHWKKVEKLAPDILKTISKDLEVASWYLEARTRISGFTGLLYGFKLIHGLIENYWDNLYPLPDEYGVQTRVSSLSGLNGTGTEGVLIPPIRNINITEGSNPGPFSFWQYQQALDTHAMPDESGQAIKISKLGFDKEAVERSVLASNGHFFVYIRDNISSAIAIFNETASLLNDYCGYDDSPSTSNILEALEECLGAVNHLGEDKFPVEVTPESSPETDPGDSYQAQGTVPAQSLGPIKSREDAFKKIKEIALFFHKTEPHSPISHILKRAIKWGEMPLEKLMAQLIEEGPARDTYSALTGITVANDANDNAYDDN